MTAKVFLWAMVTRTPLWWAAEVGQDAVVKLLAVKSTIGRGVQQLSPSFVLNRLGLHGEWPSWTPPVVIVAEVGVEGSKGGIGLPPKVGI